MSAVFISVLYLIFFGILIVFAHKFLVFAVLYGIKILMRLKAAVRGFYQCNGYIGAMVRNSFVIVKKIGEHKAELYRTFAFLKPVYMI